MLESADLTRAGTIARLNDRCRLGHDRMARTVITRNCLSTVALDMPKALVLLDEQDLPDAAAHLQYAIDTLLIGTSPLTAISSNAVEDLTNEPLR